MGTERIREAVTNWREDERGGVALVTIPVVALLLTGAVLAISMLGSFSSNQRDAQTAADAAALAAVQEWDRLLEGHYDEHSAATSFSSFWSVIAPANGQGWNPAIRAAAEEFAARNDARITHFSVDPIQQTVTVEVEHLRTVAKTSSRMRAEAEAGVNVGQNSGLCIQGGQIGWRIGGTCYTNPFGSGIGWTVPDINPFETEPRLTG